MAGIAALMLAMSAAQACFGLITMQPELQPTDPTSVPSPVTPETSGPAWMMWLNLSVLAGAPLMIAGLWGADLIRPTSLSKRVPPPATEQHWSALLMAAILVYLACGIGAQVVLNNLLPWPRVIAADTNAGRGAVTLGYNGFGLMAALAMAALASAKGFAALFRSRDVWIGILTLVAVFPIVAAASSLTSMLITAFHGTRPESIAHEALARIINDPSDPWVRVIMAGAVFGAPIIEEVMYRFLLQSALIQMCRSAWIGILVTSTLFAASHLSGGAVPWHATIPLFVLSVGLGVLHVKTGRLGPPIIVHMGFNMINVVLALASR